MDIPRFQGDPSSALDKLNSLVDGHNSIKEIRGDEVFIAVRKTPQGHTVALNMTAVLARIPKPKQSQPFITVHDASTGDPADKKYAGTWPSGEDFTAELPLFRPLPAAYINTGTTAWVRTKDDGTWQILMVLDETWSVTACT